MTSTQTIDKPWPPVYHLRYSRRARNVFLQITSEQKLEVVIPEKKRNINIAEVLEENRRWIEHILAKARRRSRPIHTFTRPVEIHYRAIQQHWNVLYEPTHLAKRIQLFERVESERSLVLMGNTPDEALCQKHLMRWALKQAKAHLIPWLQTLSAFHGFTCNQISVRQQQTLWGSCTSQQNISLNYKLLFLPRELAQHVLLHELCHTRHMNHSARFWNLLEKLDPNYSQNKQQLKTADDYIPGWVSIS